jgi:hypothetical protein
LLDVLNGIIISRQRRNVFEAQFDYPETVAADALAAE